VGGTVEKEISPEDSQKKQTGGFRCFSRETLGVKSINLFPGGDGFGASPGFDRGALAFGEQALLAGLFAHVVVVFAGCQREGGVEEEGFV
jgi:hypothetical protein